MAPERTTARTRNRLTPAALLLCLWALLIQSLVPAVALAAQAQRSNAAAMVICTQMGVQSAPQDAEAPGKTGFAGLPCHDCLAPSLAAAPPPDQIAVPVVYPAGRVAHAPAPETQPQIARAPPRPPGQGPPSA